MRNVSNNSTEQNNGDLNISFISFYATIRKLKKYTIIVLNKREENNTASIVTFFWKYVVVYDN